MAAYTELKEKFDHLQKRTIELFEEGRKREGILKTAVANAWKHFGEIAEMDDIDDAKERANAMREILADALKRVQ